VVASIGQSSEMLRCGGMCWRPPLGLLVAAEIERVDQRQTEHSFGQRYKEDEKGGKD
jgi:hypothetical protein